MGRLTVRNTLGRAFTIVDRFKSKCEVYEHPIEQTTYISCEAINKLAEYEDLEEQGLLLRLPCKVGDTFWELNDVLSEPAIYPRVAHSLGHIVYCLERLGRICFLTEKEAEEALKKMQEVESDEMRKVWKRI